MQSGRQIFLYKSFKTQSARAALNRMRGVNARQIECVAADKTDQLDASQACS